VPERSAALLEPLSKFVLEVLPWALSSLIVIYLFGCLWLAPQPAGTGANPVVEHDAAARQQPSPIVPGRDAAGADRVTVVLGRAPLPASQSM
jgi:hypothetical protein